MIQSDTKISFNNFQSFKQLVIADVRKINEDAAEVQESMQQQLCPVDTGLLKSTIEIKREGEDVIKIVEGSEQADYWSFVEYGTEYQSAQPHIRPAHAAAVQYRDRQLAALRSKY